MTTPGDAAGHPTIEEISDLTEGLLPTARASQVHDHLASCTPCTETYESLQEIRELLGSLPGPSRMPDDVAERIDAALAAEALLGAVELSDTSSIDEPATPSPDESVSPTGEDVLGSPAHVSRETSPVSTNGTTKSPGRTNAPADRPAGRPRTSGGPGRTPLRRNRARRGRTAALGAVITAAAIGLGSLLFQSLATGNGATDDSARNASQAPSDSPRSFSSDNLGERVATLMKKHASSPQHDPSAPKSSVKPSLKMDSSPGAPHANEMRDMDPTVSIPDCVQRGIKRPDSPLAAEQGTYEGADAFLVVLPDPDDQSRLSAYVVDAACTNDPSAPAGNVVMEQSYAR